MMRKVTTQAVSINSEYEKAFDYLSNPLNQKEWAINFMKDVKQTTDGFIAVTPFGEMPLEVQSDKQTGLLNIILAGGEPIPTRLIKNGNGCEFLFTMFEMPEMNWEEAIKGLKEELNELKSILEN